MVKKTCFYKKRFLIKGTLTAGMSLEVALFKKITESFPLKINFSKNYFYVENNLKKTKKIEILSKTYFSIFNKGPQKGQKMKNKKNRLT